MTTDPRSPRSLFRRHDRHLDADVEALLRGAPVTNGPLAGLDALTDSLRGSAQELPTPSPALYALIRDGFDPAAVAADERVPASAPPVRRRSGSLLVRLAGASLLVKVASGTGVAVAAVAAASAGGLLPDTVQDRLPGVVEDAGTPVEQRELPDAPPQLPVVAATPSTPADGRPTTAPVGPPTALPTPARIDAPGPPRPVPAPRGSAAASRPAARPDSVPSSRPSTAGRPSSARTGPPTSRPSPTAGPGRAESDPDAPAADAPAPIDAPTRP